MKKKSGTLQGKLAFVDWVGSNSVSFILQIFTFSNLL